MINLFYVPPRLGDDLHPKPLGVRTVVKRNQPTRLDLSVPPPGYPYGASYGGYVAPQPVAGPMRFPRTTRLSTALGHLLIRMGRRLVPDDPLPLGQPG